MGLVNDPYYVEVCLRHMILYSYMGVPQNDGYIFGVPIIRTRVFWDLYWGAPIGTKQMSNY